jgi:ATP-dependent exoDNAse (exonuclease V) beta subunit
VKNFLVYKSSAGSGKTYTLALNYICLAILGAKDKNLDYYKRILAITFTNKASSEMKERVLYYLQRLSLKNDIDNILEFIVIKTQLSKDEIFKLSSKVFSHVLHNYSDLNILTIDKFTYTIVKTFASDLGLTNNFELELDSNKIIKPAIAAFLDRITENDKDLVNVLLEYSSQKIIDGNSNNIEDDLEGFAKQFFGEENLNNNLPLHDYIKVKNQLITLKKASTLKVKNLRLHALNIFNQFQLTKSHFLRGTYHSFITKKLLSKKYGDWIPSSSMLKNIKDNKWYSEKLDENLKNSVESSKSALIKIIDDLIQVLKEHISVYEVLKKIYPNIVINELKTEIQRFKKQENIEHISEFNKRIHKLITLQSSTFIYERIGERFNHFLIDEFQDTSVLQWQNLLPIITDSIDFGKSIIVGDGKQSIYRFRGGEVQQFLNLPKIFKSDNLKSSKEWEGKLTDHYDVEDLEYNFRSKKEVIGFNNLFFEKIKNCLSKELQLLYLGHSQNDSFSESGGYIELDLFEGEDWRDQIMNKIYKEISILKNKKKYNYNDIAILCSSKSDVQLIAKFLNEKSIPVVSAEGLLVSSSKEVSFLIAFLNILQNPNNLIAQAHIISYLNSIGELKGDLNSLYKSLKIDGFLNFLEKNNFKLNFNSLLNLSLYEIVCALIEKFKFSEDPFLNSFNDIVHVYCQKNLNSLSDFLVWWGQVKDKKYVTINDSTNAVKILTIHKSKGLAYNIVFIPFEWRKRNKNEIWISNPGFLPKELNRYLINENKNLAYSSFNKQLEAEKNLSLLDNINKLYVAMTRAKDRLYVYSKSVKKDKINLHQLNGLLSYFSNNYPIYIGDKDESKKKYEVEEVNYFNLINSEKNDWRGIISLKNSALDIWDIENNDSQKDWGILLHLVLSKIQYLKDKEVVLNSILSKGMCSINQFQKLTNEINDILSDQQVQKFFSTEWHVVNEKEILMPNGKTLIPDRLLFKGEQVVIIDYKTGECKNNHKEQILNYSSALQQMGYNKIDCYLIYTKMINKVMKI